MYSTSVTTFADQELKSLQTALDGSPAEAKALLSRVAMEVNSRLQAASSASAPYVSAVIDTLRLIKGNDNAELRVNTFLDSAQFFYLVGQTFNALQPVNDAVEIAERASHQALLRKALTFAGV